MPAENSSQTACLALVVGGTEYGEADKVVHVLTERGRMSVFAHGARKSRRRFAGALDPFTTIKMDLETKRRAGLRTLKAATVERSRLGLRTHLEKIALASYVSELGATVAPEGDPAHGLYALVEGTLETLTRETPVLGLQRIFELRLIDVLGYLPNLSKCTDCGDQLPEVAYLDFVRGGLFCAEHAENAHPIGPKTLEWMKWVYRPDTHTGSAENFDDQWVDKAARKLGVPVSGFFCHLIGRPLKSLDLLSAISL